MLVHTGISALKLHYFAIWLGIFDQTLTQTLSVKDAPDWSLLAHRTGRGLRLGVDAARKRPDCPRNLRL
jgi:hemoglobin